jgi:metallophosphoesterase superfamily enzyme
MMLELARGFEGFALSPWRFVWHAATRTAVLSDVHLGAEASLAAAGIYLPGDGGEGILRSWGEVVKAAPARVVIAGDLFDSPVPDAAAVELFREMLKRLPAGCTVTVTVGNHDPDAGAMGAVFPTVQALGATAVAGVCVFHGHQSADARGIGGGRWTGRGDVEGSYWLPLGMIVGHQHPAVVVGNRLRSAKMVCCVTGVVAAQGVAVPLLVLPTFSRLPLGSNLLNEKNWILDLPVAAQMRVAGIVERGNGEASVLDFGELEGLR